MQDKTWYSILGLDAEPLFLQDDMLSEKKNSWRESLLEVKGKNIAGWCQQTFCLQKFVDITQQFFALLPQANFPAKNLNFQGR